MCGQGGANQGKEVRKHGEKDNAGPVCHHESLDFHLRVQEPIGGL
jgi:hypothetical protein